MNTEQENTIFALASARGRSGISVIRISGNRAFDVLTTLSNIKQISPRKAVLTNIVSRETKEKIDEVISLAFKAPNSFTGENVIELHCHGSVAVLDALFEELLSFGLRPAEPGEFTKRAFNNNRLDLIQAEGLADLIDARTRSQRQQALQQMSGNLSQQISVWRGLLLSVQARVEAEIDFPDEEDVSGNFAQQVLPDLTSLIKNLQQQLQFSASKQKIRDGLVIALIGGVNSGKSTLLNTLAGEDRVIVSDQPGTTRDIVEVQLQIGGYMVSLADTAGLRESKNIIEKEGIRRAQTLAETADIRVFLFDGAQHHEGLAADVLKYKNPGDLVVYNKVDLSGFSVKSPDGLIVSAKTGEGISGLFAAIKSRVIDILSVSETPGLTRSRHVQTVTSALVSLVAAKEQLENQDGSRPELVAEGLREAGRHLGLLLGDIHSEQVLDEIFSGFCIGK
ncbi:MAG: tRNA uridine-5-carboxymethylaminomethyl(34) synthesis GTPase MnmE [Robiginitomaculum sp.]|nr:tRNA uridine-5-carboxymethylaminomethyl(34) synthesis GTPase MnmE [Robiginitomaculum sp.]